MRPRLFSYWLMISRTESVHGVCSCTCVPDTLTTCWWFWELQQWLDSMIVDGHCGHWWYDRSTSAASLHEVFCREEKGGGGQTCQPESQVSQDMIQNLAGFRSI